MTTCLSVLLLAGEWFAAFDACVADSTCNAGAPPAMLETYLALMDVVGALAMCGVTLTLVRGRGLPRRAVILWLWPCTRDGPQTLLYLIGRSTGPRWSVSVVF